MITSSVSAQNKISKSDSTKNFSGKDTVRQLRIYKQPDSVSTKPILELKTILNSANFNIKGMKTIWEPIPKSENFTKEEIASGLSRSELTAYKKNKEILFNILQEKYDESWWYRVKSLGQLIGIPDWVIKILQFGLLLL